MLLIAQLGPLWMDALALPQTNRKLGLPLFLRDRARQRALNELDQQMRELADSIRNTTSVPGRVRRQVAEIRLVLRWLQAIEGPVA
jgi:hypothetical protein